MMTTHLRTNHNRLPYSRESTLETCIGKYKKITLLQKNCGKERLVKLMNKMKNKKCKIINNK